MTIEHYSFGKIVIDGRTYTSDLIIYPDRLDTSWWRKEGHNLQPEDLKEIIKDGPEVLIIGTGFFGVMKVPKETADFVQSKGIEIKIARTGKAIELFNDTSREKKVVAALHLTC